MRKYYSDTKNQLQLWEDSTKCKTLQEKWGPYNKFKSYIKGTNKEKIVNELFNLLKKVKNTKKEVLDVGSGTGHFSWLLKNKVSKIIGVDFSEAMINLCKEQFSQTKLKSEFVQGSCWNLPFSDNSFDIAFQIDVCMHIGGSWEAIKEMIRVSREYILFTGPSFVDSTESMNMNFRKNKDARSKRWGISQPLLIKKLEKLKKIGEIDSYIFLDRNPTENYQHKILVVKI